MPSTPVPPRESAGPDTVLTRPGEGRSSAFGSTLFDGVAPEQVVAAKARLLFDVCHVGVVLRAVLFVHAVMAAGMLFIAADAASWFNAVAGGSAVVLPAVLSWLVVACLLKHPLERLAPAAQWVVAVALGSASGMLGWALGWVSGAEQFGTGRWIAPAVAGAGLSALMFQWLRMRALAQLPADTTARLAELQSRIRPHFLFNTLNTALSLVQVDPARAEEVLEDLAELFRVALTDTGESVTLAEEVELARRYLAIEQIRFGSRLSVSWDLDADAGAARVPPLLLQPLVENAVRHGIAPVPGPGRVSVAARRRNGELVLEVHDTGAGFGAGGPPRRGVGLSNTESRLRQLYGDAARLELGAGTAGGATVAVTLPYRTGSEEVEANGHTD